MTILKQKIAWPLFRLDLGLCYRYLAAACVFVSACAIADDRSQKLAGRVVASADFALRVAIDWEETKGRLSAIEAMRLRYFIRGERGDEAQLMHDLRRGRAHIGVISLSGLANAAPELEILMVPSLFGSYSEAEFVYDNYLFELSRELLARKGLRLMQRLATSPSSINGGSFSSFGVVANRDWFNETTDAQQTALGNAWVRGRFANARVFGAADAGELSADPDVYPGLGLAISQAVTRIGGRSAEFYAAIMRGKLAYSAR